MFDLEKYTSGHFKKNFNVPWPDDYDSGYNKGVNDYKNSMDLPKQTNLNNKTDLCGYIDIDGNVYQCDSCNHEKIVKDIIYDNSEFFKMYRETDNTFYKNIPIGMMQEEYFLMKKLGFVKVSSFEYAPMDKIVFRYNDLTWKQTDSIYKR